MSTTKSCMVHCSLTMLGIGFASLAAMGAEAPSKELPAHGPAEKLGVGDHELTVSTGRYKRTAIVHVPPDYTPKTPTPVVLALHGAIMTGEMMAKFSGLNETADAKGFVVVYPSGTGIGRVLTWNAGGFVKGVASHADDVAFIRELLDEIGRVLNVDSKRIYATGMSNGGMMCYRLAAELSDRIAAIAPVGGTMPIADIHPHRPVSVMHFHGTLDTLVPFETKNGKHSRVLKVKSVQDSVRTWAKLDGIDPEPNRTEVISKDDDELKVIRQEFGPGKEGAEVVLVTIEGGGHTWPGQAPPVKFIGKSAMSISANNLMWAFFEKHPMK